MSATSTVGKKRSLDLDQRLRISFMGGRGLRLRVRAACSGGVYIDGVRRLGVINRGVNKWEMRDSMVGEEFSSEPAVYESSLTRLVRIELNLVEESYGLN